MIQELVILLLVTDFSYVSRCKFYRIH